MTWVAMSCTTYVGNQKLIGARNVIVLFVVFVLTADVYACL